MPHAEGGAIDTDSVYLYLSVVGSMEWEGTLVGRAGRGASSPDSEDIVAKSGKGLSAVTECVGTTRMKETGGGLSQSVSLG